MSVNFKVFLLSLFAGISCTEEENFSNFKRHMLQVHVREKTYSYKTCGSVFGQFISKLLKETIVVLAKSFQEDYS